MLGFVLINLIYTAGVLGYSFLNLPEIVLQISSGVVLLVNTYLFWQKHQDCFNAQEMHQSKQLELQNLQQENNENRIKIRYLEETTADAKKFKDAYSESMKSSMLEMSHQMVNQVLNINKHEHDKLRQTTDGQIASIASTFKHHFTDVVEKISFISKDFSESKQAIDLIRKNIFNPIGAGKFTEISLENILRKSGLIEGVDFFLQKHIHASTSKQFAPGSHDASGIEDLEISKRMPQIKETEANIRPDAIIILPNNHLVVVDAKASKAQEDLGTDKARQDSFKKNIVSHIKQLSGKAYNVKAKNIDLEILGSKKDNFNNDFERVTVLMFLVSEDAVSQALCDPDIMDKCVQADITPVGPSSLLNMLSIYRFYIQAQKREANFELILQEVEQLLGSVDKLSDAATGMATNLSNFNTHYDKFFKIFHQQMVCKAQKITHLGLQSKKFKQ